MGRWLEAALVLDGSRNCRVFGRAATMFQGKPTTIGSRLFVAAASIATKKRVSFPLEKRHLLTHTAVAGSVTVVVIVMILVLVLLSKPFGGGGSRNLVVVKVVPVFLVVLGIFLAGTVTDRVIVAVVLVVLLPHSSRHTGTGGVTVFSFSLLLQ